MNFQTIAASKPQGTLPSDGVPLKKNLPDRQRLVRKLKSMYEDRRDWEDRWKEIRDYQLPSVGEFDNTADKTNPARRRDLSGTGIRCWRYERTYTAEPSVVQICIQTAGAEYEC